MTNNTLDKLRAGEVSLGVGLRQARNAETAVALETAGFDWVFLDLEHNAMSLETAAEICVAVLPRPISTVVRVPEGQYWLAQRLLDNGAEGIVIPHVDTAEQAREVVRQLRYPPVGHRSISSMQPHVSYRETPVSELVEQIDRKVLIAVMLESELAIENADEIAAVDGIDVLMIGGNDLCLDFGIPGQVSDPRIVAAFQRVADVCASAGRFPGFGGVRTIEDIGRFLGMGFQFLFASDDLRLMVTAGTERTTAIRNAWAEATGARPSV